MSESYELLDGHEDVVVASSDLHDKEQQVAPTTSFVWPCAASNYRLKMEIAQGHFSHVWSGLCLVNGAEVAIKVIDLDRISTSFDDILDEIQSMRLCNHINLLGCYGSFVSSNELWLISQLMDKGSCQRVMEISKQLGVGEGFSEECVGYILSEILKGVQYLHEKGYVHRDIRSGNMLLDTAGSVKLSDFSVGRWLVVPEHQHRNYYEFCSSHTAPEILDRISLNNYSVSNNSYENRADIWSIGIAALELAKGESPVKKYTNVDALKSIIEEELPSLKSYPHDKQQSSQGLPFSKFFEDFYKKCLQKNPKLRPSAAELIKHKLLRGRSRDILRDYLRQIPHLEEQPNIKSESEAVNQIPPSINSMKINDNENTLSSHLEQAPIYAPGTSWVFEKELIPNMNDKKTQQEDS